jgi:glycine/D-amino acid oxidase-like deaminating enzyme
VKERLGPQADIGFVERGYLILGGPETIADRRAGAASQRAVGADVIVLTPNEVQARFSWLNVDDLGIATTAERNEGWFDAWSLLSLVRQAARDLGVTYVHAEAEHVLVLGNRVTGVRLSNDTALAADWCVDAAGAASPSIVAELGIKLPVSPRKRTIFSIRAPLERAGFPMLFDTTGAWIRPEGEGFICGIAPAEDNDPDATGDFEPDHALLEDVVWPALAHRIPALEQLRVVRAWAGHYEVNTLDHNGVIGPHDEIENLIFATGFSGHGVMHAPATGRGVAELITTGAYKTLDLSPLGFSRIRTGTPLHENVVY